MFWFGDESLPTIYDISYFVWMIAIYHFLHLKSVFIVVTTNLAA